VTDGEAHVTVDVANVDAWLVSGLLGASIVSLFSYTTLTRFQRILAALPEVYWPSSVMLGSIGCLTSLRSWITQCCQLVSKNVLAFLIASQVWTSDRGVLFPSYEVKDPCIDIRKVAS
jgi:hypothetical protein